MNEKQMLVMQIISASIFCFLAWYAIGAAVLCSIDKDQKLYNWLRSCPIPGGFSIGVCLWPILTVLWLRSGRR